MTDKEWRDFKNWASRLKEKECLKLCVRLVWIIQDMREELIELRRKVERNTIPKARQ